MTEDERLVYDAVKEIQGMKNDSNIQPDYAILFEIFNYLRHETPDNFESNILQTLRTLYRKGFIEFHKNVNGVPMFGIKE